MIKLNRRRKENRYQEGQSTIHQIGFSCNEIPPKKYGGIELQIANVIMGQERFGHQVICYSPGQMTLDNVTHYKTLDEPTAGPKDNVFKTNVKEHLDAVIKGLEENYKPGDIIQLHHSEQFWPLYTALKKKNPKRAYNFVECTHWLRTGMQWNIAFPSAALKHRSIPTGIVVPEAINHDIFHPQDEKVEDFMLVAGRVTPDKGVHITLEAAKKSGIKLKIAGPTPNKEFADQILNDPAAEYLGELTPEDLRIQYSKAKALVYMTQYLEPGGAGIVEAMACGCPVITTGKGATSETVLDKRTGFYAQTADDIIESYSKIDTLDRQHCIDRSYFYTIERRARNMIMYYRELYG